MTLFHGTLLYAVYGRNVGTFGGRAKASSLKIYDTRNCGSALKEIPCIPNNELVAQLRALRGDRQGTQDYLARCVEA
jgi:hypothetical protein